jgi:hypothetical protein
MALDFSKLRDVLQCTRKPKGAPNLTVDVRIEVRAIDKPEVGGLIWKVGSPSGGYGPNTNQAAGVLTMLAARIGDMECQVRRNIAGQASGDDSIDVAVDG